MRDEKSTPEDIVSEVERLRRRVGELEAMERELRRTVEALQWSHETAKVLLNTTTDAAVLISTDGTLLSLNELAAQRFGRSTGDLMGRNLFEVLPPDLAYEKQTRLTEVLRSGTPVRFVTQSEGAFIDTNIHPIFASNGKLERLAAFFRDVTPQVQAEVELRKAKESAEMADMAKTGFVARMSHELRTPLNSIIGFAELLEDEIPGKLNETQLRYIGHILNSGRHLLTLINEILDLAKIEAGKMELDVSDVNVVSLFESGLNMVREEATRKDLSIGVEVSPEVDGVTILADELKFKEIVVNLLSNAVKFTPQGGSVLIQAAREGDELMISVTDQGIGVKREDHQRIFEPFEQVDSPSSRRRFGTGLGLSLSKRLVELHGGQMWVESEGEGRGSTFRFTIPFVEASRR